MTQPVNNWSASLSYSQSRQLSFHQFANKSSASLSQSVKTVVPSLSQSKSDQPDCHTIISPDSCPTISGPTSDQPACHTVTRLTESRQCTFSRERSQLFYHSAGQQDVMISQLVIHSVKTVVLSLSQSTSDQPAGHTVRQNNCSVTQPVRQSVTQSASQLIS